MKPEAGRSARLAGLFVAAHGRALFQADVSDTILANDGMLLVRACGQYILLALLCGALSVSAAAQESWNPFLQDREFNPYAEKFATQEDSVRASWFWYEKGRRDEAHGGMQVDKALDDYTRAAELNPRNVDAHCRRADVLSKMGRYHGAAAALQQALNLEPRRTDVWLKMVDALLRTGGRDEAISTLDSVLRLEPERTDLWLKKASLCSTPGRLRECVAAYEQVIRFDPDNKNHRLDLAFICDRNGWIEKANEVYDAMHQRWPQDTALWIRHANLLLERKRWPESVSLMDRALAIHPDQVSLRLSKLEFLRMLGMIGSMESESREILKRDTSRETRSRIYQAMEPAYESAKQWDKAGVMADSLIALEPDQGWVWEVRANLGDKVGRSLEEQLADFDSAIVHYPREDNGVPFFPDPWLRKCKVLVDLGRTDEALAILDSLLAMRADWARVWRFKAYVLAVAGKSSEALSCIETALRLDPNDDWSCQLRAQLAPGPQPRRKSAASHKFDPRSLFPGGIDSVTHAKLDSAWEAVTNASSPNSVAAIQRFNVVVEEAMRPKDLDTAAWLRGLIEAPRNSDEWAINANLLAICGKLAEAEKALTHAIEFKSWDPLLWFSRARVRAKLGRRNEALEDSVSAVNGDPQYKQWARADPGFQTLWNDSLFQGIVGGGP